MNLRWRVAQFFEIRWWWRYLSRRDKEAYFAWKRHYWQDFLQKSDLEIPSGASVLDAGCGPAGIFIILKNQTVDALDSLLERYEKAFLHFRRRDWPQVRFFTVPLEGFFPEKKYDFVFCLNALNHVADLPRCLDRLAALTKRGGTLAVSIDAHNLSSAKRLFRLLPADILHPHQYDLEEYRAMLEGRGFQIEKEILLKKGMIFNYCLLVARKP
jgi:2-polyprenyl-6-hydroxyphenyl methylase/3-demethylubiquinone-9 3-methyltransferase